ncbi:hypothetical protein FRB99_006323 [Tulasnella sp. 403]|nr:hypothetical protein FRB99_006323 [Tulasnella sp. 403]
MYKRIKSSKSQDMKTVHFTSPIANYCYIPTSSTQASPPQLLASAVAPSLGSIDGHPSEADSIPTGTPDDSVVLIKLVASNSLPAPPSYVTSMVSTLLSIMTALSANALWTQDKTQLCYQPSCIQLHPQAKYIGSVLYGSDEDDGLGDIDGEDIMAGSTKETGADSFVVGLALELEPTDADDHSAESEPTPSPPKKCSQPAGLKTKATT